MNARFSTREVTGDLVQTGKWWVQKADKDRRAVVGVERKWVDISSSNLAMKRPNG